MKYGTSFFKLSCSQHTKMDGQYFQFPPLHSATGKKAVSMALQLSGEVRTGQVRTKPAEVRNSTETVADGTCLNSASFLMTLSQK